MNLDIKDYLTVSLVVAYHLACICAFDRQSRSDRIAWEVVVITGLFWIVVIPVSIVAIVLQNIPSKDQRKS